MIRIIGDCHNIITPRYSGRCYLSLIQKAEYSLQLGDFGFDYSSLKSVDAEKHRILLGNHEHYEKMKEYPHFLGNFGNYSFPLKNSEFKFFYIRGGRSVDQFFRKSRINWFYEEELNYMESKEALEAYSAEKPEIMVSHEYPSEIIPFILRNDCGIEPSHTAELLQRCYEIHRPKIWIYGHFHVSKEIAYTGVGITFNGKQIDNGPRPLTKFTCLDELDFLDIDDNGNFGNIQ
jgi:hypothetical protein